MLKLNLYSKFFKNKIEKRNKVKEIKKMNFNENLKFPSGNNKFVVIDVETANQNSASICQIGLAKFDNGKLVDSYETLINPEDYFDGFNVDIHGINEKMVAKAPTMEKAYKEIIKFIGDDIIASHTLFDKVAMDKSFLKYNLPVIQNNWIDTTRVVRRTWEACSQKGYGLKKVCKMLKINMTQHHNALSDAIAAGEIFNQAIKTTQMNAFDWLKRCKQRIDITKTSFEANDKGFLYGEAIVFTGEMKIPRVEASRIASEAGCTVRATVTKTVTMLVVGELDMTKLKGHEKSSKQRKAELLITEGADITILSESDFFNLLNIKI